MTPIVVKSHLCSIQGKKPHRSGFWRQNALWFVENVDYIGGYSGSFPDLPASPVNVSFAFKAADRWVLDDRQVLADSGGSQFSPKAANG